MSSTPRKEAQTLGHTNFACSLTPDQMADLELQTAIQQVPVKQLRTPKELADFFNGED
ncbi:hypothetical protein FC43_GL001215 [Limosilactobacillus ingluviei DSM 15946]|uniref:Uncharacterized protein n=1 Tax=Limosilactobacillus ingluviei DSM 15946 TaxID=1423760 RepID=A0A0R1UMN8_9LACO|nr:hypothetical protein FC43_GL001215 [Limosilactobacillus ingluviei DSM 15946]